MDKNDKEKRTLSLGEIQLQRSGRH